VIAIGRRGGLGSSAADRIGLGHVAGRVAGGRAARCLPVGGGLALRPSEIHPEMRFSTITATGLDAARFAERADRLAATVRDELREPRPETVFYVLDAPDGLGKRHDAAVELLTGLVSGAAESTTVRRE